MPRIRTVKPGFFRHELLQELEDAHVRLRPMLVFEGLWLVSDREGRFEWNPKTLKLDILPFIKFDLSKTMDLLVERGFITRYECDGLSCGMITNWRRHQLPGRDEPPSELPSPDGSMTPYDRPPNATVRTRIYARDNYTCVYCQRDLHGDPRAICLDHVIPYCVGGTNSERNLVTSCKKCNAIKGDRNPEKAGFVWPKERGESYRDTPGQPPVNGIATECQQSPDMERVRELELEVVKGNGIPVGCDLSEEVFEIAKLHPKIAHRKKGPSRIEQEVIAQAIAQDGRDLVLAGTRNLADAVAKWPVSEHKFIPEPVKFYQQENYKLDPAFWDRRKVEANGKPNTTGRLQNHREDVQRYEKNADLVYDGKD